MRQWERVRTVDESLTIATDTIKYLGLGVEEKVYGYGDHPKTYHCQLFDPRRKVAFYGLGKGIELQSKASAYFEALEHYVTYDFCQKLAAIDANYRQVDDTKSPLFGHQIPFARFTDVESRAEHFCPLYLIDPRYTKKSSSKDRASYTSVAWQASDSGTASGTNMEEAAVHALNESIERHSYSLFLIEAFLKTKRDAIRRIDKGTLPAYLQKIICNVEQHYNDDLRIFELPNEFGIPSCFVSMTRQPFPFQPRGCGTSLSPTYAVERALLETLQPLQVANQHLVENQKSIIKNFARYPHLKRCAEANVCELDFIRGEGNLPFNDSKVSEGEISISEQLTTIIKRLRRNGRRVYSLEIASLPTGFCCVRYLIPDLESFYLVQAGKFVLPKMFSSKQTDSFVRNLRTERVLHKELKCRT